MTLKTIAALSIAALAWLACGVDEEPKQARTVETQDAEPDLSRMSVNERKKATEYQDELGPRFFVWAGADAGERDAVADTRECREQALAREDYVRANGMIRFAIISECMKARGWTVDQAAVDEVASAR